MKSVRMALVATGLFSMMFRKKFPVFLPLSEAKQF
jgi:hypothetical protein